LAGQPCTVTRPPESPASRRTAPLNLTDGRVGGGVGVGAVGWGAGRLVVGAGGWEAVLLVQPTAASSSASSNVRHGGGQMRASRVLPGRWNRRVYLVNELGV
jgi:hypothetical protein